MNSMSLKDSISEAVKDFETLFKLLNEDHKSGVGRSFRARCREIPGLIEDIGFVPAMTFCYAKSGVDTYQTVRGNFQQRAKIHGRDETKTGYAAYLYLILKRLKDLGMITNDHFADPLTAFEVLQGSKARLAGRLVKPYALQLKKLSEAVFEAEEERD